MPVSTLPVLYDPFMCSKLVPPGWLFHYQDQLPAQGKTLVISGTQLLCADSEETLSRRFHLSDASFFLITANFSAPTDQHQLSQ